MAGIVTNTGLYTVNLMVMGWSSNVSLLKDDTIFSLFRTTGIGGEREETGLAGGGAGLMAGRVGVCLG